MLNLIIVSVLVKHIIVYIMNSLTLTCTRHVRHASFANLFHLSKLTTGYKVPIDVLRKSILQNRNLCQIRLASQISNQPEHSAKDAKTDSKKPKNEISAAMKFYLEKKKRHDAFIASERSEFELGKKHLANMMGMDYDAMTQEDVDKAIDYLFPSGLYEPSARPKMKPPEEVNIFFSDGLT